MLKKPGFAVSVLNIYIITFLVILQINISQRLEHAMFLMAPFIAMWAFYIVIHYSHTNPFDKKKLLRQNGGDLI